MSNSSSTKKSQQQLLKEISEARSQMPTPIVPPQHFVDDTTPEGLRSSFVEQNGRAAAISDEGGVVETLFGGLYNDGNSNIDGPLKGHAGGDLRVRRAGQSYYVSKIAFSMGLTVQPEVLASLSSGAKRGLRGRGALARVAWVIPESNIGKRDVVTPRCLDPEIGKAYADGLCRLLEIQPRLDDDGEEQARILVLSPEGLKLWQQFAQAIEERQGPGGVYEPIQDWTGKLPGLVLRLAGLMHVAIHGETSAVVETDTMTRSIELARKLLAHAMVAFDSMGSDAPIADAKYALRWAQHNHIVGTNDALYIRVNALHSSTRFKNGTAARVLKAIEVLRERHIFSGVQLLSPEGSLTGKPAKVCYINPAALKDIR